MRSLLLEHARRYPLWECTDLYKLLHQSALGPEHAVTDEARARAWLERELSELDRTNPPDEPLLDPLNPDGTLVRVHLRPWLAQNHDSEALLQAFVRTANTWELKREQLSENFKLAQELVLFDMKNLTAFFREREAQGFPAVHHSEAFRQHYHPAYRVVARALLPQELARLSG